MSGYGVLLPVLPFFVERLSLNSGIDQETINFHIGKIKKLFEIDSKIFNLESKLKS